ncbi:hypothetical protein CTAYLR_000473 [Chrysophaeum taylorii]|uniref:Ubiquinol oxidase n=1 Tax=Chrysophaeum taylorii TaxID=2483200 RepID=A0AAD7UHH6_9STRA|nr:hypothetical protein CTAYLR_000473 [Chrysophaeum taylorii]
MFCLVSATVVIALEPNRPPPNVVSLIRQSLRVTPVSAPNVSFSLSNERVWRRERSRAQVDAPIVVKIPYFALCYGLDVVFDNRPIARFWFLESVARMPYFAYISMLHLYESCGFRPWASAKRVHFSQEYNEYHHLLIMEALGGSQRWGDRFLAYHSSIVYYWVLVALWLASPSVAYKFSELIEAHAVDTYGEFLDANEDKLRAIPAPRVAKEYYKTTLFRDFDIRQGLPDNRDCDTLYDVFANIRDDEMEHVCVAAACSETQVDPPSSSNFAAGVIPAAALIASIAFAKYFQAADDVAIVDDALPATVFDDFLTALLNILPFT